MIVAGIYSFNHGREIIETQFAAELDEVKQAIAAVISAQYRIKTSQEKTIFHNLLS